MTHNRVRNKNKLDTIVPPRPLRSYGGMRGMRRVTTLTRVQQHTALRPLSPYQIGGRDVRCGNIGGGGIVYNSAFKSAEEPKIGER